MNYHQRPAIVGCQPGYGYAPLARASVSTGALTVQSVKDTLAKDSLGIGLSNGTLLGIAAGIGVLWYGVEEGWFGSR